MSGGKIYIGDKEVGTVVASKIAWGPSTAGKTFDASVFGSRTKTFTVPLTAAPRDFYRFGDVVRITAASRRGCTAMFLANTGPAHSLLLPLSGDWSQHVPMAFFHDEFEEIE